MHDSRAGQRALLVREVPVIAEPSSANRRRWHAVRDALTERGGNLAAVYDARAIRQRVARRGARCAHTPQRRWHRP